MKEFKIEFSIHGVGDVHINAEDETDAIQQFDEISVKELAGWCYFSSFTESGIHIIAINGESVEADLWEVMKELGLK